MILSRNVKHIKKQGPKFLKKFGFKVLGPDIYMLDLYGGTVSFLVREIKNPELIYSIHVQSWFGELQLIRMFAETEARQHNVRIKR